MAAAAGRRGQRVDLQVSAVAAVPEQVREVLDALRMEGLRFELAWPEALRRIVWPRSQRETAEWERALESTKDGWRATYEGWEPLPSELAVAGLFAAFRSTLIA